MPSSARMPERRRGRRPGVDPAVERGEHDRGDEVAGVPEACRGSRAKDRGRRSRRSRARPRVHSARRILCRCIERTDRGQAFQVRARAPKRRNGARQADRGGMDGQRPDRHRQGVRGVRRRGPRPWPRGEATGHGAGHRSSTTATRPRAASTQGRATASSQPRLGGSRSACRRHVLARSWRRPRQFAEADGAGVFDAAGEPEAAGAPDAPGAGRAFSASVAIGSSVVSMSKTRSSRR